MATTSFAQWWMKWFGLEALPEWFGRLWPLLFESLILEPKGKEGGEETATTSLPSRLTEQRRPARWADEWPTRRRKARSRFQQRGKGWMFLPGRPRPIRVGKPTIVHVLDYRVSVNGRDRVFRTLVKKEKDDDDGGNVVSTTTGHLVVLATSSLPSQEAFLARAEQDEKTTGIEVTSGLRLPSWISDEERQQREADPLYAYLNTDWTPLKGQRNPDLLAKFSSIDLSAAGGGVKGVAASAPPQPKTRRAGRKTSRAEILDIVRRIDAQRRKPVYTTTESRPVNVGDACPQLRALAATLKKKEVKPWLRQG